jgi:hypothetical protein
MAVDQCVQSRSAENLQTPKKAMLNFTTISSLSHSRFRSSGMDHLTILLHRLPQELFDHVYNDVFTAPACRINVRHSYRLPHLLSVSSASRKQFAKSYYYTTLFIVDNDVDLHIWLRSLAVAGHLQLLREVRFMNRSLLDAGVSRLQGPLDGHHKYRRTAAEQHAAHMLARLRRNLKEAGLELPWSALKLEQHFINDSGVEDVIVC